MSHSYTMQVTCDCLFVNVLVDIVLDIMFVSLSKYHACIRYLLILRWVCALGLVSLKYFLLMLVKSVVGRHLVFCGECFSRLR